jgi:hypothetical protein
MSTGAMLCVTSTQNCRSGFRILQDISRLEAPRTFITAYISLYVFFQKNGHSVGGPLRAGKIE